VPLSPLSVFLKASLKVAPRREGRFGKKTLGRGNSFGLFYFDSFLCPRALVEGKRQQSHGQGKKKSGRGWLGDKGRGI